MPEESVATLLKGRQLAGDYLSPAQVAELLGVSKRTVLNYIKAGKLPVSRLSRWVLRIRRVDVEAFILRTQGGRQPDGGP